MLNLQNLDCGLAGGFIGKVTMHKREWGWERRENGGANPCFLFSYPNTSPPHVRHLSLKSSMCPLAAMGTTCLRTRITLHLTYLRQARSAGGADAFRQQPGRCRKVSRRDVRWGQSIRTRCKLCFVTSLLPSALSPDKGIVNSHVNLSLLNVQ